MLKSLENIAKKVSTKSSEKILEGHLTLLWVKNIYKYKYSVHVVEFTRQEGYRKAMYVEIGAVPYLLRKAVYKTFGLVFFISCTRC